VIRSPQYIFIAGVVFASQAIGAEPAAIEFTRDIRPILSRYCFKCHGPDDKARQAGLRLDRREEATQPIDSGNVAIVPGKPDESELVRRIFAEDENERMPPASTKMHLSEVQKKLLRDWIAAGAEYKPHWAYVPPKRPRLPKVRQTQWPRNAIDHFVLARLEQVGRSGTPSYALELSPQADRYTLIRRVSLDLIGLPPTPEDVDAFVSDKSPDAYERLVDRLLTSKHYGERWARRWLDLARYSDTNGYEKDRPRSIWAYRDWVIDALNADMTFDQFTVEQLAGDMLPRTTLSQRIATGFHRNTMLNEEGGIDPLEFRFHAMTDRVATTGTTWLGLTLGCAQCHSHKFDPISHREYYGFMAFLNNADEPELDLPSAELEERHRRNLAEAEKLLDDLPRHWPGDAKAKEIDERFAQWRNRERERTVDWQPLRPIKVKGTLPLLTMQPDDSVFVTGDMSKSDTYELSFRGTPENITAIRLEALPDERLPMHGPGRVYYEGPKGDFFLSDFSVWADGQKIAISKASHSFASANLTSDKAIDADLQSGWAINGGQGRRHAAVFALERPLAGPAEFTVRMLFERYYAAGLGRFRISATTTSKAAEARDLSAEIEELLLVPDDRLTPPQRTKLFREFLLHAPELAEQAKRIRELRQRPAYPTTLVMQERPPENPRHTFIHHRGEFLQPKERVEPAVPEFLPFLPEGAPRNRLGLALWLVSPQNPLTARVAVNRQWAAFFGKGLVRTTEDFGVQGELPSHPELLDWLAVEFSSQGSSLKKLHKLIVTSATYQQASRVTPAHLANDAENRLLARGPRVRLEAELIRDAALHASGLLTSKAGGPSVFPPQPASVTTEGAYGRLDWKPSQGEDRYRRSLYTFSKRTAPFAMYATFDAPSGESCVARRDASNTPLQALTLLNDAVFIEAAQALGKVLAAKAVPTEDKVRELFGRCLTRPPTAEELSDLLAFYHTQKQRFAAKPVEAAAVAGTNSADGVERAAWTTLARAVLNFDEIVTKN
jgi:hypothetical protein